MKMKNIFIIIIFIGFISCQNKDKTAIDPVVALFSNTTISAERTYRNIDNINLKLDVYSPSKRLGEPPWVKYTDDKKPVLLYFHGGGWRGGEKESRVLEILPYVAKGWVVVTANYRLLNRASLPEIVGDCKTALDWVYDNADHFKIDTTKIVISGNSAGGHLALMTALAKEDTIYKCNYPLKKRHKVAAVINWYGISDVAMFVGDWTDKHILIKDQKQLEEVYKKTSPLHYIDKNSMPVLTVHGAIDKIVPFIHAEKLHKKLEENGVKNKLIKINNRKHGDFNAEEMTNTYREIWNFLDEIGINNI